MDKQMIEELAKVKIGAILEKVNMGDGYADIDSLADEIYHIAIPEGAVLLTDDELNEVIDTCKVSMIVTDDDGEKYISLDEHNEYTERLGKIVRQRKARIEYLEKLLDDRCDRCIERERKETAEKFAEALENRLDSIDTILHEDNEEEYLSANKLGELIDEICKEITEGKA